MKAWNHRNTIRTLGIGMSFFSVFAGLPAHASTLFTQCGKASWYNLRGQTASGEAADPEGLTAAHRSLPFGSKATVTNLANGKSITVRINDRGPFSKGRVIDLTQAAAAELGFLKRGVTRVKITGHATKGSILPPNNCQ